MLLSFFLMSVIVWNSVTLAQSVKCSTISPASPSEPKVFVINSVTVSVFAVSNPMVAWYRPIGPVQLYLIDQSYCSMYYFQPI